MCTPTQAARVCDGVSVTACVCMFYQQENICADGVLVFWMESAARMLLLWMRIINHGQTHQSFPHSHVFMGESVDAEPGAKAEVCKLISGMCTFAVNQ